MSFQELPLFPLNTVLFPGGVLPLRIFEPRYLNMVSGCMKAGHGFGVVAIQEGSETGTAASFQKIGTLAQIADFDRLEDGLLGIICQGGQRLQIMSHRVQTDQLILGRVNFLPDDPLRPPLPTHAPLLTFLRHILEQKELQYYTRFLQPAWDSAAWVGNRVAELLPLPLSLKQALLELTDPTQRLDALRSLFKSQQE